MASSWASRVGQEIKLGSWDECVSFLLEAGGDGSLYRGQRCFDWDLRSSLERALLEHAERWDERTHGLMLSMVADAETDKWARDVERALLQRFRQNAMRFGVPELPEAWDILGWWEVMQHHNAPTRLMDWSSSPFIALWFALDGHQEGDGDMALWVYDRDTAAVNWVNQVQQLKNAVDYDQLDERRVQNRLLQLVLERGFGVLVPVRPRQFPRTVAQQSVLTISPSIGVARPASWWINEKLATRIRLREEWKPKMQAACRSMGYSRYSLFRDLDSLGKSIAEGFVSNSRMSDFGLT